MVLRKATELEGNMSADYLPPGFVERQRRRTRGVFVGGLLLVVGLTLTLYGVTQPTPTRELPTLYVVGLAVAMGGWLMLERVKSLWRMWLARRMEVRVDATPGRDARRLGTMTVVTLALLMVPAGAMAARAHAAIEPSHITYGTVENEVACVYAGEGIGVHKPEVLVHGGWWGQQGKECEDRPYAEYLAKQGITVVDINYPEDTATRPAFPSQPEAVRDAVRWVQAHATEYSLDPEHIGILGGSTGGNIALLGGEMVDVETPGVVKDIASLSGPTNLLSLAEAFRKDRAEGVSSGFGNLAKALGCPGLPVSCNATAQEWSTTARIPAACPAFYVEGGATESIIPFFQQEEMDAALAAAGCEHHLRSAECTCHSFNGWLNTNNGTLPAVREEVLALIQAH